MQSKYLKLQKIQVLKLNGNINVLLVSSIDFKGTNVLDVGLNIFYCIFAQWDGAQVP